MGELVDPVPHLAPRLPEVKRAPSSWRPKQRLVFALLATCGVAAAIAIVVARGNSSPTPGSPPAEMSRVSGDTIEVPAGFRETAGIATEAASAGHLAPLVTVVGEAAFDPTLVAAVGTRTPGIVRKVHFVEGSPVEKGELLAEVESPALAEVQAERQIAEAKQGAAELNAERESQLLARGLTTAREHEQAAAQLAEQRALYAAAIERVAALGGSGGGVISQLRAPVAGVVVVRSIAPGQSVGPGLVAFRVGSLDRLWVLLRVYERHLEVIRMGDAVEIRAVAAADRPIQGTVAHVGNVVDPSTRTADVRIEVGNEERLLRPGQAVRATIRASGPARVALSVPASAVTSLDGVPTVFVAATPTRFVARKVELGIDGGDRIEVKSGVSEGEQVVSRSVLAIKSELFR
jgi:membrane fusion protein, heavy metal efflux system